VWGLFGIARSVCLSVHLSVPWRSCLGYRHAGCLQLSHCRPPEMCGLSTRPQTDVDLPRFLPPSNCHLPGTIPCSAVCLSVCVSQVSRCILAQWPLRYIRSYECSGRGRFVLETGSNAAQGAASYVLHTRPLLDSALYDKIDAVVSEQASLHEVSQPRYLLTCIRVLGT